MSRKVLFAMATLLSFESLEQRTLFAHFDTPFDHLPNFVETPDTVSIANGHWNDSSTWSNGVPDQDDLVHIVHHVSISTNGGTIEQDHPGDFNHDGDVNFADYEVWQDGFGTTFDYQDLQPLVEGLLDIPWEPEPGDGGAYDAVAEAVLVDHEGKLSFGDESSLSVETLQVLGELEVGTDTTPINAEIVFLDAPLDTVADPSQYGHGLLVVGGKVRIHGQPVTDTFVRATGDIQVGATTIEVAGDLTGWQAGDVILLPDTRQNFYGINTDNFGLNNRYEEIAIASISGQTITLATATQYAHLGARDAAGVLRFTPHVARVGGNTVVIRSENPAGTRGHTMFTGADADIDIRYASFRDLGRTTNAALNNTTFDSQGNVTHVGTNQIGRYAVHFHHIVGPAQPLPNGYQFNFIGNEVVSDIDVPFIPKWPVAVHDSHFGLIEKSVVYVGAGFGIGTEDGTETGNRFNENITIRIDGTKQREKFAEGRDGSGIWLRRPNNYLTGNVSIGATKAGFGIYGGDNFQVDTIVRVPAYQGANPHIAGQYTEIGAGNMHLLEFDGNEAYASYNGLQSLYVGFKTYYLPGDATPASNFTNFSAWHIDNNGVFSESTSHSIFDGLTLISDANRSAPGDNAVGFNAQRATNGSVLRNSNIENYKVGVVGPTRVETLDPSMTPEQVVPFIIENNVLKNEVNFSMRTPAEDALANFPPRRILLRNNQFTVHPIYTGTGWNVSMIYYAGVFANVVKYDELIIEGYNGHDYAVYYSQQAASFIVPQSGATATGPIAAPVAGLTNQQLWDMYGLAVAGEVAPGAATTMPFFKSALVEQLN